MKTLLFLVGALSALVFLLATPAASAQGSRRSVLIEEAGANRISLEDGVLPSVSGSLPPSGTGRVWRTSWLHDPDGDTGPDQPFLVEVEYLPKPGESATVAASKFADDVQTMRATFPPNVRAKT